MFKENAVKRTVTATFQKPDGSPSEGKVRLQLDRVVLGRQENTVYSKQYIEVELDQTGSFSKELAVTNPGLTAEEQTELDEIADEVQNRMDELLTVQERINDYIQKMTDGDTITPTDKLNYDADQERKRDLQLELADYAQQNKNFEDKLKELQKNAAVLTIQCRFENPKDQSRIRLIIPAGEDPIDIADLPRE